MRNERIAYLLLIIQAVLAENVADSPKNSFLSKILNPKRQPGDRQTSKRLSDYGQIISEAESKCKNRCSPSPRFAGTSNRVRFTNQGGNSSENDKQMEAPSSKYSILNVLTGEDERNDDDEDEDDEEDDDTNDEKIKETEDEDEEEEEEEEGDGLSFLDDEEDEINPNKLKDKNDESSLKQYQRHRFRLHRMVFPLLLAYKLKFFTVIPLLLGSLVLLVGTTGIAGFFFALFAAALGLHVKSSHHH